MKSAKEKIALHVGADGSLPDYMETYTAILEKNAIDYVIVDSSEEGFWDSIKSVDIFIYRWAQYDHERQIANTILPIIENNYKKKCFPDELTSWLYDDKLRQQLLFQARGLPIIPGHVVFDKKMFGPDSKASLRSLTASLIVYFVSKPRTSLIFFELTW